MRRTTSVISVLAHALAAILVVWILLDLFDANQGNGLVNWFHTAADWLSGWSRGLFTVSNHTAQVLLDYGIPAVVYVVIGNLVTRSRALD
ncbi:membrane protein [Kitasatospora phosalacinea]|uniref:membrane protein n=1 Tax=Kitasatospora phosalacinea TaxID=2065 RepID=UPI0005253859|nr:membrane protein [Kitasatospora phosalacinea]